MTLYYNKIEASREASGKIKLKNMDSEWPKLKKALSDAQWTTGQNLKREKEQGWNIYDSGLVSSEEGFSYDEVFEDIYPIEFANIRDFIEARLAQQKGKAVGIEFGGSGSRLFSEFSPGFLKKSVGVALTDPRNPRQKESDMEIRHDILEADIFSSRCYRDLDRWLEGDKVDVIFEKMHGGSKDLPDDPDFLASIFNRWYRLLGDTGLMIMEIPPLKKPAFEKFKKILEQMKNGEVPGLKLDYETRTPNSISKRIILILEKNKNAPKDLNSFFLR